MITSAYTLGNAIWTKLWNYVHLSVILATTMMQVTATARTIKPAIKCVLHLALIATGYLVGVYLHPHFAKKTAKGVHADIDMERLYSQPLADIITGAAVNPDTLFSHERNLLVFWNPTCKFSRQFFNYRLNSYEVGVFCFPMTDDLEYAQYFVEKHNIQYQQLGSIDSSGIIHVDMPPVKAVPTFVVLDGKGTIIAQKTGIIGIDTLLDNIYNYKNNQPKTDGGDGI